MRVRKLWFNYRFMQEWGNGRLRSVVKAWRLARGHRVYVSKDRW